MKIGIWIQNSFVFFLWFLRECCQWLYTNELEDFKWNGLFSRKIVITKFGIIIIVIIIQKWVKNIGMRITDLHPKGSSDCLTGEFSQTFKE